MESDESVGQPYARALVSLLAAYERFALELGVKNSLACSAVMNIVFLFTRLRFEPSLSPLLTVRQ